MHCIFWLFIWRKRHKQNKIQKEVRISKCLSCRTYQKSFRLIGPRMMNKLTPKQRDHYHSLFRFKRALLQVKLCFWHDISPIRRLTNNKNNLKVSAKTHVSFSRYRIYIDNITDFCVSSLQTTISFEVEYFVKKISVLAETVRLFQLLVGLLMEKFHRKITSLHGVGNT